MIDDTAASLRHSVCLTAANVELASDCSSADNFRNQNDALTTNTDNDNIANRARHYTTSNMLE
jgi:hypothetical protein